MRDAIVRYGGVGSDCEGEVGRLDAGDVVDDKGSKRFDCAPAAILESPSCVVPDSSVVESSVVKCRRMSKLKAKRKPQAYMPGSAGMSQSVHACKTSPHSEAEVANSALRSDGREAARS